MYSEIVLLGVILSLVYAEITGFSPGGLIVPGYLALSLSSPRRIVLTLCVAALTTLVLRLLGKFLFLYGRRRFAAAILLGAFISLALGSLPWLSLGGGVIGCLIPGIIARECDRQGFFQTILGLAVVTGLIVAVLLALGLWQVV